MTTPILPPFPFPELWGRVSLAQQISGQKTWLVPEILPPVPETDALCGGTDNLINYMKSDIMNGNVFECEDEEELEAGDDVLVLNEEWAMRFSKTIRKMKQKVHKARRRAAWTNKSKT